MVSVFSQQPNRRDAACSSACTVRAFNSRSTSPRYTAPSSTNEISACGFFPTNDLIVSSYKPIVPVSSPPNQLKTYPRMRWDVLPQMYIRAKEKSSDNLFMLQHETLNIFSCLSRQSGYSTSGLRIFGGRFPWICATMF
jgi:hypothetical protein